MNIRLATHYLSPSVYAADDSRIDQENLERPMNNSSNVRACYWFDKLLHGQRLGRGCLPYYLGLSQADFEQIRGHLDTKSAMDSSVDSAQLTNSEAALTSFEKGTLRQDLMDLRLAEWEELRDLVRAYSHTLEVEHFKLPEIVAAGCLGGDHLWRDLGFINRAELSEFMQDNFPRLAALNVKDMKWKKFFYKQLCEQEGGYVCRSPSCEACTAYDDCFGSED